MVLNVLREERLACGFRYIPSGSVTLVRQVEADIMQLLDRDDYMIGSDAIPLPGLPHPRGRTAVFRAWSAASAAATTARSSRSSSESHRTRRSASAWIAVARVQEGFIADLVVFDEAGIIDLATYDDPALPPAGIPFVIVNGQVAVNRDGCTRVLAGHSVR